MDDPWGSPWADEIQHDVPIKIEEKNQVNAAPKTPVKIPLVVDGGDHDTWGVEDDGFGDWASSPVENGFVESTTGFSGVRDRWETRQKVEEKELPVEAIKGHSIAWENADTIHSEEVPTVSSNLTTNPPVVLRQPSPDPWASHTTINAEVVVEDPLDTVISAHHIVPDEQITKFPSTLPLAPVPVTNVDVAEDGQRHETTEVQDDFTTEEDRIMANSPIEKDPEDLEGVDDTGENKNNKDFELDHESSRPSSSPSDHDENLPESPRTSLDDEPKRPPILRKGSSKVQELVQHFDHLANSEVEESFKFPTEKGPLSKESGTAVEGVTEEDGFDDDFGDFEDGDSDTGEISEVDQSLASKSLSRSFDPDTKTSDNSNLQSFGEVSSPPRLIAKKDFGRVQFTFDASAISQLYPSIKEDIPEKIFIPDGIPHDSFSKVEERKMWYRISRYGTMQKHNAGNDENYIRINWTQSQIRKETLKIVSRWMEEDRMGGRVAPSGANGGSSFFGWNDANAAPVALADAFSQRSMKKKIQPQTSAESEPEVPREWPKSLVRSRSSSKTRSPPKPRRRTSSKSKRSSEEAKVIPQVVASFGWNSNPSEASSQVPIPFTPKVEIENPKSISPPRQSFVAAAPALSPIFSPTFPVTTPSSINGLESVVRQNVSLAPIVVSPIQSFNQDDNWGEMMSIPVKNEPQVSPLAEESLHTKEKDVASEFPASLPPSPTTIAQMPSSPVGPGHKPTASLDDLLVPKTRMTPRHSYSGSMSLDIFDSIMASSPTNHIAQPLSQTTATPIINKSSDPWASVDFSFFDTPAPAPAPTLKPSSKPILTPIVAAVVATTPAKKSVAFHSPPVAATSTISRSKLETEQDRIVTSIVMNLPDLSYMLRK